MDVKRHLLIGAVGLVKGGVREDGRAMVSICDELEPFFISESPLQGAPFDVVSVILRYGTQSSEAPEIGRINRAHSELEVAVELPMQEIKALSYQELRERFKEVTLDALIGVAKRYGLPTEVWARLRR
jgi:hypothetical protein